MRLSRLGVCILTVLLPLQALAEPLISGDAAEGPSFESVQNAFRTRVMEAFPEGTKTQEMTERLTSEGFEILEGYAEVIDHGFPCDVVWRVLWRDDAGKVADLDVVHNGICL